LLVEDDQATRSALKRIYASRGWAIDATTTLAEARARLAAGPDFVILDLMLPDGDGAELLRAIRRDGLPIGVIVATGCGDRERLDAVRALRPEALLAKPIDLRDVDAILEDRG
jgi:DNA-binding response OmpR family regulator